MDVLVDVGVGVAKKTDVSLKDTSIVGIPDSGPLKKLEVGVLVSGVRERLHMDGGEVRNEKDSCARVRFAARAKLHSVELAHRDFGVLAPSSLTTVDLSSCKIRSTNACGAAASDSATVKAMLCESLDTLGGFGCETGGHLSISRCESSRAIVGAEAIEGGHMNALNCESDYQGLCSYLEMSCEGFQVRRGSCKRQQFSLANCTQQPFRNSCYRSRSW